MGVLSKGCCDKIEDNSTEKIHQIDEYSKSNNVDAKVIDPNQKEGKERVQWASQTEFLLTCVGFSVGLGNVWRFPYLCYKNGGGAFLIPYVVMMLFLGIPLLFMEYTFGQYFGVGALSIFKKVCPMFQGTGIAYMVINGLVCIYYNVIIALALYYLFASFQKTLPWGLCGQPWNTDQCGDPGSSVYINESNSLGYSTLNSTSVSFTVSPNSTLNATTANITRYSPSDEYFRLAVLGIDSSHSISNLGEIRWHLCLCLLLAWILVVLFVSKGIQSSGKVAYFTATFPYVMLTVLVARGATLPGATDGIIYFLKPQWEKLASPKVWFAAASQLFYSTNLAWGGMITMASYSSFNHNCYRDAIAINFVSFFTSIYAGFAVFAIIGYMANEYGLPIDKVIDSGPGLAFIAYPRALSLMPVAPLWSSLFFFMIFLLGIGSQMVLIETVITGLVDEFPLLGRNAKVRFFTTVCLAVGLFLMGISMTTQGGMFVLQLLDHYAATFGVLTVAVVECVVINWSYGNDRFCTNIKEMLGHYPGIWWRICWKYISPVLIIAILIFSVIMYEPAKYGTYLYPIWADLLGWVMVCATIVPIFAIAIWKFYFAEGPTFRKKWQRATMPCLDDDDVKEAQIEVRARHKSGGAISLGQYSNYETSLNDDDYDHDESPQKSLLNEKLPTIDDNEVSQV